MLLCNTYVTMRIALNPTAASAFGLFAQSNLDERLQRFFHKQLERLQGLAKLCRGVDTIITAAITTKGSFICVCAHAYCRLTASLQNGLLYITGRAKKVVVKFI